MKTTKIILIGAGAVGTAFVYSSINQGLAGEYGIIDQFDNPRDGNVLDFEDVIFPSTKPYKVYAADYKDVKDADFIVITAGRPQKPGETRLEMVKDNAEVMRNIARQVRDNGFKGITVIASNPVDIITWVYIKETGFDYKKVIGSGTILDTSRLRYLLSQKTGVSTDNIEAFVLGEHGDSSLVNYSGFRIAGMPFSKFEKISGINATNYEKDVEFPVSRKAYKIIERKRATFWGIGACLAKIVRSVQADSKIVLPVGVLLNGEYGYNDVVAGVPAILGANGIEKVMEIELNDKEKAKLDNSINVIKKSIDIVR
ncbi:L-lactate dehydrogenase [Mesomycoplasma neurolyticum]|uniref:L-lactate dehydrogenase n=1 Tax=Mesomycoplasma neurolyticum TaxID=2120 RepID=A0A449A4I2_9BACT|nr:L-lactate dehydrogenase [Mesomycoplasma neurolyticum]VEU59138.1 L-lactate/malate dehydrogenase [Mesomycoplasma neurolyticum]